MFPELAELLAALADAVIALDAGDRIAAGEAAERVRVAEEKMRRTVHPQP